jgi:hypothetical protein
MKSYWTSSAYKREIMVARRLDQSASKCAATADHRQSRIRCDAASRTLVGADTRLQRDDTLFLISRGLYNVQTRPFSMLHISIEMSS